MSHIDNGYSMNPPDPHYAQQPQRHQTHHQQQWAPHLLQPSHSHPPQPPFPSPPTGDQPQHYPPFYHSPHQQQPDRVTAVSASEHLNRAPSSLSLNLSSLSVTSPTNLSPINPSSGPAALSPATPISPSTNPFSPHGHSQHHHIQPPFQFDQNNTQQQQGSPVHYDDHGNGVISPPTSSAASSPYDSRRTPGPSRPPSTTTPSSQLPRKRSFTSNPSASVLVEESMYDEERDAAMELASQGGYDDMEMRNTYGAGSGSPVDGSGSASGGEDALGGPPGHVGSIGMGMGMGGPAGGMNIIGKTLATNNFVTKLYQMINDPKSAHFISWTELGTSFVVSNVGEFSRSILGSHFKHNNFSSFVRQLNMYGFHKINRTPRAQRSTTDVQTWEFSHNKFLRGRPDLLDEIKRKALEPDPALKHRVELPGEVAAQLGAMKDENRRVWEQLMAERKRTDKMAVALGRLWEVVGNTMPGHLPPFPSELLENESPNIYITSPPGGSTGSRYPPPLSMNMNHPSPHSMHSISSPNSSPTGADFPPPHHPQQQQHPHALSRQHSLQHVGYSAAPRGDSTASTPLPASPGSGSMDLFDDGAGCEPPAGRISSKRQRMSTDDLGGAGAGDGGLSSMSSPGGSGPGSGVGVGVGAGMGGLAQGKKSSRARSDSAPLGYGFGGMAPWQGGGGGGGRPRSGSGLAGRGIPNIGSMTRSNGAPMLPVPNLPSAAPNR